MTEVSPEAAALNPLGSNLGTDETCASPEPHTRDDEHRSSRGNRAAWLTVRLAFYTVATFATVFPRPALFSTHVPGDTGDSYLILALIRWGGRRTADLFSGYWQGPMFGEAHHAMAYSDTFLPLAPPFGLLDLATGSPVIASNVLFIVGWVLCAEATYHLFRRICSSRLASFTGSVAFGFAVIRTSQFNHYQLVFFCFVPLAIVAFIRLVERPTVWRGLLVGTLMAVQMLVSAYYGVVLIVSLGVALGVVLLSGRRESHRRRTVVAAGSAMLSCGAMLAPIFLQYRLAIRETGGRDFYPATMVMRPADLRSVSPRSRWLDSVGFLRPGAFVQSSTNFAYVGLFVLIFVPIGIVFLVRRRGADAESRDRRRVWAVLAFLALVGMGIAYGRQRVLGISNPIYPLGVHLVPGVGSLLALGRLTIFLQLSLVAVATVGFAALLRRVPKPALRMSAVALICVVVLVESAVNVQLVEVPRVHPDSVFAALEQIPAPANVVVLPMVPPEQELLKAFADPSRMVLTSGTNLHLLNGHSGQTPLSYSSLVAEVNTFPSPEAIARLDGSGTRYVVLLTKPIKTGDPAVDEYAETLGYAYYKPEIVAAVIAALPPGRLAKRIDSDDGILLVLRPG